LQERHRCIHGLPLFRQKLRADVQLPAPDVSRLSAKSVLGIKMKDETEAGEEDWKEWFHENYHPRLFAFYQTGSSRQSNPLCPQTVWLCRRSEPLRRKATRFTHEATCLDREATCIARKPSGFAPNPVHAHSAQSNSASASAWFVAAPNGAKYAN